MYLGFLFMLIGWAIWLANPAAFLVPPLFVVVMNRFQIGPEEKVLQRIFGVNYQNYQDTVRRWL